MKRELKQQIKRIIKTKEWKNWEHFEILNQFQIKKYGMNETMFVLKDNDYEMIDIASNINELVKLILNEMK